MDKGDLKNLKEILSRNPEYADKLQPLIDELSAIPEKATNNIECEYDCELPYHTSLNSLRELYYNHHEDPDWDSISIPIIDYFANEAFKYIDSNENNNNAQFSRITKILIGESLKVSIILGFGGMGDKDIDAKLGELFRNKAVPGDEVTKHLLGGLKMRLGDFRKETKDLPDDWVLDEVMFIDPQPSYYDGFPCDYVNHKLVYTCENKIRFRIFDPESRLWDICDPLKSYDENLIEYMKVFTRGRGIPDYRWENYLDWKRHDFDENWNNREWQDYMLGERAKDVEKKEIL